MHKKCNCGKNGGIDRMEVARRIVKSLNGPCVSKMASTIDKWALDLENEMIGSGIRLEQDFSTNAIIGKRIALALSVAKNLGLIVATKEEMTAIIDEVMDEVESTRNN